MDNSLKYVDDDDRLYGLTGMAVGIVIADGEELLASIDVDAPAAEMMQFTPQFYFAGNPRLSARLAWNHIVEHYRLSIGLLAANVMCRRYVLRDSALDKESVDLMRRYIADDGHDTCSLDDDEIDALFNEQLNNYHRIFLHEGVKQVVRDFAATLKTTRRMTASEVVENLRTLAML